jgi:hypothetical protein
LERPEEEREEVAEPKPDEEREVEPFALVWTFWQGDHHARTRRKYEC